MANVTACLDCGGSVSDSARACPHCRSTLYSQAKRTHRRSEEWQYFFPTIHLRSSGWHYICFSRCYTFNFSRCCAVMD